MKGLLILLSIALLSLGASACGSASTGSTSASATATGPTASTTTSTPDFRKADSDKDNDGRAPGDDTNNSAVLDFGHAASPADKRAVTALVKRYYAAAAAGNGAKTCSMLLLSLAEAVPEDYGRSPGPSFLRGGRTCPAVMELLFRHFHTQLAAEVPLLKVASVRLTQHHGLAVLSFGSLPERQIPVVREGHIWRIEALIDSELP